MSADVYYYDSAAGQDFVIQLCRSWRNSSDGANPGFDCIATFSSAGLGQPGYAYASLDPPDFDFLRRVNVDGDPELETVDYMLYAQTYDGPNANGVGPVRVRWSRQVSPTPLTATFGDVPVGHQQHRFVEALAAAGITAGCGGGNYCPDTPLTRGQMAVFLSVALGLHWSPF